tara:strand:+ start:112 stop:498 length:387 start_codon:yes stop_codon:yes gene_type:complete
MNATPIYLPKEVNPGTTYSPRGGLETMVNANGKKISKMGSTPSAENLGFYSEIVLTGYQSGLKIGSTRILKELGIYSGISGIRMPIGYQLGPLKGPGRSHHGYRRNRRLDLPLKHLPEDKKKVVGLMV